MIMNVHARSVNFRPPAEALDAPVFEPLTNRVVVRS